MARPQQFNNDNRQVVDTIEQQNKYNMPDGRRMRVYADPLNIPVAVENPGITQLAQALGQVKPALMEYGVEKKAEKIEGEINQGKLKAQTEGDPTGEYQQWGYDSVKAVNDWTAWNQQVIQAYQEGFDKDEGDLEQFLKDQWDNHNWKDNSQVYFNKFSPLAQKTMQNLREHQGKYKLEKREQEVGSEIVRMFKGDIDEVSRNGIPWDVSQYEHRRETLRTVFPGKTRAELDEYVFEAVVQKAMESNDESLFNVFKKDHTDGTPGLYNIPKWRKEIDTAYAKVLSAKNQAYADKEKATEKALKEAGGLVESRALLTLIKIQELTDPDEREQAINEVVGTVTEAVESGLPIGDGVINTIRTFSAGVDRKDETKSQQDNYVRMRANGASRNQILSAYRSGDISLTGFNQLMSKSEAAANKAADKPYTTKRNYKDFVRQIDEWTGAGASFGTTAYQQARSRKDASVAHLKDRVEELVDSGKTEEEAINIAGKEVVETIKNSPWNNKAREKAGVELDVILQKQQDPVGFYTANPDVYTRDLTSKTVPQMTRKQQEELLVNIAKQKRSQAQPTK